MITEPRKRLRAQRHPPTAQMVLTAASTLLQGEGKGALTASRIAQAAGISVGAFYQHFANKDAIITQLVEGYADEDLETFARIRRDSRDISLGEAVPRLIATMFAAYRKDACVREVVFEHLSRPDRSERIQAVFRRYADELHVLFNEHRAELGGAVGVMLPFVVLHAVEGCLREVVMHPPDFFDEKELVRLLSRAVLALVGAKEGG